MIHSSSSRFLDAEEITLDELAKQGRFIPRVSNGHQNHAYT